MNSNTSRKKSNFGTKKSITKYKNSIEHFLKKANKPYSQLQIAEELFDIPLRKEGNVPSSNEQLLKLSYIKDALKTLTQERKIIGSLIEDPIIKEEVMCYSTR